MEKSLPSITITHVLEHLFCPRFTYFEHVLCVPERQERRWKVQKGREVHLERAKVNKSYLRKKLDTTDPALIHTVRGIGYVMRVPREA